MQGPLTLAPVMCCPPQAQARCAASRLVLDPHLKMHTHDAESKSETLKSLCHALALALLVGLVIWCFCFTISTAATSRDYAWHGNETNTAGPVFLPPRSA